MVLPRFLAELKHRNVYRAAVVYAAVGWALLEAADVVLPRLVGQCSAGCCPPLFPPGSRLRLDF